MKEHTRVADHMLKMNAKLNSQMPRKMGIRNETLLPREAKDFGKNGS